MPEQKSDTKVGDIVLYQPTRHDWLRGGSLQIPAIVQACDEESGVATLIVFPTAATMDFAHNITKGDGDGQYMKQGEESKTAKAIKKAREEARKAEEERNKKEEQEAKKAQEEQKQQKDKEKEIPTAQQQLNKDQRAAELQYKYPQPPQQEA